MLWYSCLLLPFNNLIPFNNLLFPSGARTPLGSQIRMVYDINIMKLLYDCLDAMRVSRDDADELLRELTAQLPDVLSG